MDIRSSGHTRQHNLLAANDHDTVGNAEAVGDMIRRAIGNVLWERLPIGASANVLTVSGGLPVWASPAAPALHNILSASHDATVAAALAGDILRRNAGNTAWERLPIGAATNVLTVVAGLPAWAAAGGGGGSSREDLIAMWDEPATKTNIGTAFVDIYNMAGSDGLSVRVDFTGKTQVSGRVLWNKIGTGTQNVRCVDRDNVANVLFDIVVVNGANILVPTALPAWATGIKNLKLQAKSTIAADDPVFRGANINLVG